MVGNQGNPIVIRNDDMQFMERRVPPIFIPRAMLRPAGAQLEGRAQAVPVNPVRRRRPHGNPYRAQNNDHCFNCGKSRYTTSVETVLCFRSAILCGNNVSCFAHLRETWLAHLQETGLAHLQETGLGNNVTSFLTFEKDDQETMFPGLSTFKKHG